MSVAQDYRNVRGFILRGTRTSQPVVADVLIGSLYFVTGENVLERSNGTIWESYSVLSGGNAGGLHGPPGIDGSDGFDGDIYPNGNVVKERTTPVFTTVTTTGNVNVGNQLLAPAVVQHAIGGTPNANAFLTIGGAGTFTGSSDTRGLYWAPELNLQGIVGADILGFFVRPTMVEAASGTHGLIAGFRSLMSITAGAAATTLAVGAYFSDFTAPTGTVTAASLYVPAAPTGATTNYALLVDAGNTRLGGQVSIGTTILDRAQLILGGTFSPPDTGQAFVFRFATTINCTPSDDAHAIYIDATFVEAASGTHALFTGINIQAQVTVGVATLTNTAQLLVGNAMTATVTGVNYSIWSTGGPVRLQGLAGLVAGDKYLVIDANGNLHVSALGPAS